MFVRAESDGPGESPCAPGPALTEPLDRVLLDPGPVGDAGGALGAAWPGPPFGDRHLDRGPGKWLRRPGYALE
jgi:hypothetical protein